MARRSSQKRRRLDEGGSPLTFPFSPFTAPSSVLSLITALCSLDWGPSPRRNPATTGRSLWKTDAFGLSTEENFHSCWVYCHESFSQRRYARYDRSRLS